MKTKRCVLFTLTTNVKVGRAVLGPPRMCQASRFARCVVRTPRPTHVRPFKDSKREVSSRGNLSPSRGEGGPNRSAIGGDL